MTVRPVTVELPEAVYERVERTAKGLRQPLKQTLVRIVAAGLPSLAKVPPEQRPALQALESLGDDELRELVKSEMAPDQQNRLEFFLRKNQAEGLNHDEEQELDKLHARANAIMLQNSYAALLLKWREKQLPDLAWPSQ